MPEIIEAINVPINAKILCTDGKAGISKMVVINPTTKNLTAIVVEYLGSLYLVPRKLIASAKIALIELGCTRQELSKMDLFEKKYFIDVELPDVIELLEASSYVLEPFASSFEYRIAKNQKLIPEGELAINRSNIVHAKDGRIGKIDEFAIHPKTGDITHLILREGHLWGKYEIAIPVDSITKTESSEVFLSLTKKEIARLPRLPVERRWE